MGQQLFRLSRFLPPPYPDRLAGAAADRNHELIDQITDELSARYPGLVRKRTDGAMNESLVVIRRAMA